MCYTIIYIYIHVRVALYCNDLASWRWPTQGNDLAKPFISPSNQRSQRGKPAFMKQVFPRFSRPTLPVRICHDTIKADIKADIKAE